jgi:hypothetical protein
MNRKFIPFGIFIVVLLAILIAIIQSNIYGWIDFSFAEKKRHISLLTAFYFIFLIGLTLALIKCFRFAEPFQNPLLNNTTLSVFFRLQLLFQDLFQRKIMVALFFFKSVCFMAAAVLIILTDINILDFRNEEDYLIILVLTLDSIEVNYFSQLFYNKIIKFLRGTLRQNPRRGFIKALVSGLTGLTIFSFLAIYFFLGYISFYRALPTYLQPMMRFAFFFVLMFSMPTRTQQYIYIIFLFTFIVLTVQSWIQVKPMSDDPDFHFLSIFVVYMLFAHLLCIGLVLLNVYLFFQRTPRLVISPDNQANNINVEEELKKLKVVALEISHHNDDSVIVCSVCSFDIKKNSEIVVLNCDHQFHHSCLTQWLKIKFECPNCRQAVLAHPINEKADHGTKINVL